MDSSDRPMLELCADFTQHLRGLGFPIAEIAPGSRDEISSALNPWVAPGLIDDDLLDWYSYWWSEPYLPGPAFMFPSDPVGSRYFDEPWSLVRDLLLARGDGSIQPDRVLPVSMHEGNVTVVIAPSDGDGAWRLADWDYEADGPPRPFEVGVKGADGEYLMVRVNSLRELMTFQLGMAEHGCYSRENQQIVQRLSRDLAQLLLTKLQSG